jgi:hypothetical protein
MSFLLRKILAIFLIAGLGVSPLYAATMKGMEQSAQASSMAGMAGMADDMPCHPAKSSSDQSSPDKACPFMVACLSLCFQGMPPVFGAIVIPATLDLRTVFESVRQLTDLAPSPPARPPRA